MENQPPCLQTRIGSQVQGNSTVMGNHITNQNYQNIHNHYTTSESKFQKENTGKIGHFNFDLTTLQCTLASRDYELGKIRAALAEPVASGAKIAILVGMGGAGKTTLGKMYTKMEITKPTNGLFKNLIWIDAEVPENVTTTFRQLSNDHLEVHSIGSPDKLVNAVYNSILKYHTILVFDNVEEVEETKKFLPKMTPSAAPPPTIIVTTRVRAGWEEYKKYLVPVTELSLEASKGFIRDILAGSSIPDVGENWKALAQYAGCLVAALRAASLYVVEQNKLRRLIGQEAYTLKAFLVHAKNTDIFEQENYKSFFRPIRELWTSTMETLAERPNGQVAERMLTVFAYLSPEDVPASWFTLLLADYPGFSESSLKYAMNFLASWSLVGHRCEGFSVHRVLQMTLLSRIKSTKRVETLDWLLPAMMHLSERLRAESKLSSFYPRLRALLGNIEDDARGNVPDSVVCFLVYLSHLNFRASKKLLNSLVLNVFKDKTAFVSLESLKLLSTSGFISDFKDQCTTKSTFYI